MASGKGLDEGQKKQVAEMLNWLNPPPPEAVRIYKEPGEGENESVAQRPDPDEKKLEKIKPYELIIR